MSEQSLFPSLTIASSDSSGPNLNVTVLCISIGLMLVVIVGGPKQLPHILGLEGFDLFQDVFQPHVHIKDKQTKAKSPLKYRILWSESTPQTSSAG